MKLIEYSDNDELNKPDTCVPVYVVDCAVPPITRDALIAQFPEVFSDGVSLLEGKHHIKFDKS